MELFEKIVIANKLVYIADHHHKVLMPWAIERRKLSSAPYLITIDHYSDTDEAFRGYASILADSDPSVNFEALRTELVSSMNGHVTIVCLKLF
jgi:hypothetical protein